MADPNKGINSLELNEGHSEWYVVTEAECINSLDTMEELFEESTDGSIVSNLIDDSEELEEGNSLALYNEQLTEDCNRAILALKRKLTKTPLKSQDRTVADLSPRLEAVTISPQRQSKRRLFEDSGLGEDEATNSIEKKVVSNSLESNESGTLVVETDSIFRSTNRKATLLAKFKEYFGVAYGDLTRPFKSDRSCCENWVISVCAAAEEVIEASKTVMQQHCDFLQVISYGFYALYLVKFKTAKSRDTIMKLFSLTLNVQEQQLMCDPPKSRSTPTALYFYRRSFGNASFIYGPFPDWLAKLTMLDHESAASSEQFELAQMIQFAYDNNLTTESEIAYKYALLADSDANAAAFLKSNQQVKYVRDCYAMLRYYKRQEMKDMSISEWIWKCCDDCNQEGNWKLIAQFLRYQEVNFISFLCALKTLFKGIPKRNCLVFWGPPDTGKSYICSSLTRFMQGKVVSFMNRHSQFWLQPLQDCKLGFLDDATFQCWQYMDVNMRNALDGNHISLDLKHKAPLQIKLPPLLITTNVDVENEASLMYLKSRLVFFKFPNKLPLKENDEVLYEITDASWKCFFIKFASHLELTARGDEQHESGRSDRAFRCTAGTNTESI
ncbi:replication protein E1 [Human papillomavirus type 60]|uniref:Replication protein E1 n=1 Tax=Human papillomavirus type 60 TaxID=40540 RepID=VE1_HPV60|nr:replication protein E1 [Human papillomavirus type 60]Q80943.1 RecName: Full=Replication protein E1; AltName: Full=ATP-dependent helicase E1 [Human papillomavirus type 60]AAA79487.1 replication protein E1 [Human papillomavirus type 60]